MSKIKPLEWKETLADRGDGSHDLSGFEAETSFGTWYLIEIEADCFSVEYDLNPVGRADSPDEAKAIAQHDFEQRIRRVLASAHAQDENDSGAFDFAASALAAERICDCMDNNIAKFEAYGDCDVPPAARELYEAAKKLRDLLAPHRSRIAARTPAANDAAYSPAEFRKLQDIIDTQADMLLDLRNEVNQARAQVESANEALKLAEDVLSRAPFSTGIWPNGMHPQTGIDVIRAALTSTERQDG
jgi:hypothetical protein